MWDWIDQYFSFDLETGPGGGTAGMYAWNTYAESVPYVGWYLGAYAQVRDDMVDLKNPAGAPSRDDDNSAAKRRNEDGIYDSRIQDRKREYDRSAGGSPDSETGGSSGDLLRDPGLLADNSSRKPADWSWTDPPDWFKPPPEIYDGGTRNWSPSLPPPPEEVVVRGPPRNRHPSTSHSPILSSARSPDIPAPTEGWRSRVARPESHASSDRSETNPKPRPEVPEPQETNAEGVQRTREVVVEGKAPIEPPVSDKRALEAAENMGRIQWGDLRQLARGGYNGLISASQEIGRLALRQAAGPITAPLMMALAEPVIQESNAFRLSIDPRYGGAGIIGEQFTENLVFEGLPHAPQLASSARRALGSGRLVEALAGPAFWFAGAGGAGAGSGVGRALRARRASTTYRFVGFTPVVSDAAWADYQVRVGSPMEAVFEVNEGGKKTYVYVDHIEGNSLVEAKYGDMGQMWIPERDAHIHQQVQNYLALMEAFGFGEVRYVVSTRKGADRLMMVFSREYPMAVQSGRLTVVYAP